MENVEELTKKWQEYRLNRLKLPDSWLTLVGLYWLNPEADNVVGARSSADDVTIGLLDATPDSSSQCPERVGILRVGADQSLEFEALADVALTDGAGSPLPLAAGQKRALQHDGVGAPTKVQHGSLLWFVILRSGRLGIRVKDSESAVRTGFQGMQYFPASAEFRCAAVFEPAVETLKMATATGELEETQSPGVLKFTVRGQDLTLRVTDGDDLGRLEILFADQTSGKQTYGGGRFVWTDKPDADGRVILDFNQAYTPPCFFTEFAVCPRPPTCNRLPVAIEAGEKATHS